MTTPSTGRLEHRNVLNFSTPVRLGILAATLVGVGVLASLFLPSLRPGPGPIGDAPPTAGATQIGTVAPSPSPSPTTLPTPASTPVPTAASTPVASPQPTAGQGTWTGLVWSDPVTPAFEISLWDAVPWRDGYVAVGLARGEFAFLSSPNGVDWSVAQQMNAGWGIIGDWHLVVYRDQLFSFSPSTPDEDAAEGGINVPVIHHSTDGRTWSLVESPTWTDVWAADALILEVVAGPNGIVAIGDARAGEYGELLADPVVLQSTDGYIWANVELDGATDAAVVWDAIAWPDGYAILGGLQAEGSAVGVGLPAAWWSSDGLTWTAASLEGARPNDNHFAPSTGFAAVEGLVARTQVLSAGAPPDLRGWLSIDGRSWHRATDLFVELPSGLIASDGARLVAFATDEGWRPSPGETDPYPGLTRAWSSLDGAVWQPMSLSHPMTDELEGYWVVPDGVIYAGRQSFWFGVPVVP
jgi:hypothetical protein